MNYEEARVYLDDAAKYGSVLGLDSITALLAGLDNPQRELKFVHIAGTNGKGSVQAYLAAVLKEAGYRVGRYISPTLFCYRERIQVDEAYIDRDSLARYVTRIAEVIRSLTARGISHPTVFEIETALSFLYFREQRCDLVLLEVGMGGREDATNVVDTTVLEVITSISMDHMGFLGSTLAEIAWQKAGIIKPGTLVVSAAQQPEAMEVIRAESEKTGSALRTVDPARLGRIRYGIERQLFDYGAMRDIEISLAGCYQIDNAALAVEAVEALRELGYRISEEQLRNGLKTAGWKGRFSVIGREPLFIMDGAHNRDGADRLVQSIRQYFPGKKLYFIMGVFKDKEYDLIARMTAPLARHIVTIQTPDNPRALESTLLAETVARYNKNVEAAASIPQAVERCMALADKDDVILAFGSLSFHGELLQAVEARREYDGSGKN